MDETIHQSRQKQLANLDPFNRRALRRLFKQGEVLGSIEILSIDQDTQDNNTKATVRCTVPGCGFVREVRIAQLRAHERKEGLSCVRCRNRRNAGRRTQVERRDCKACDDCPALRPSNGSPCKCGATRNERRTA